AGLAKYSDQSVEKNGLLRMEFGAGFVDWEKARLIDFPRSAGWRRIRRRGTAETVDDFGALAVFHLPKRKKLAGDDSSFFKSFAARRDFQVGFARIGFAFGNAPGFVAVIVAAGVNEHHFQSLISVSIKKRASCLLHGRGSLTGSTSVSYISGR